MGLFGAEENVEHITQFTGASKEAVVKALHNHSIFLTTDPNYISHETVTETKNKHEIPGEVSGRIDGKTVFYEQKDSIPGYAAKFLPGMSSTTNHYQITDLNDGLYVHLNAALDVVIDRVFQVRDGPNGPELYENFGMSCSKLLVGTVKHQFSENWSMFHTKYVETAGGKVTSQS